MKILAIGNSFSVNAMYYLERMAAAGKSDMTLGNLYIGGCSLNRHYDNMLNNTPDYDYYIHCDGSKVCLHNHTLLHAIISDDWDIITFQQVSQLSGVIDSFEPYLEKLVNFVKQYQKNAKLMLHQTWAYEKTTEHPGFSNYDCDQEKMYNAIKEAYDFYSEKYGFDVIPCGDAFQIARSMDIFDVDHGGKSLCNENDKFHASFTHGQYLLGAVWYEKLTGKSILENPYSTDGISFYELMSLKKAAHLAVNQK